MSFGIIAGGIATGLGASAGTAAIVGGVAAGAGQLYSANKAAKSQTQAAQTAANAQLAGADILQKQYESTKKTLDPFITGQGGPQSFQMQQALSGALGADAQKEAYANYVESPGVSFLRERGMRGIEQNAAAGGSLYSGNTLKALSEFNQGLALQDFNNYYNRLGSLTGVSLNAAQALGGVGGQSASGQAALTSSAGMELGAGQIAKARTYQSAYENLGSTLGNVFEAWQNRK